MKKIIITENNIQEVYNTLIKYLNHTQNNYIFSVSHKRKENTTKFYSSKNPHRFKGHFYIYNCKNYISFNIHDLYNKKRKFYINFEIGQSIYFSKNKIIFNIPNNEKIQYFSIEI